jgi:hypothetical protein
VLIRYHDNVFVCDRYLATGEHAIVLFILFVLFLRWTLNEILREKKTHQNQTEYSDNNIFCCLQNKVIVFLCLYQKHFATKGIIMEIAVTPFDLQRNSSPGG